MLVRAVHFEIGWGGDSGGEVGKGGQSMQN